MKRIANATLLLLAGALICGVPGGRAMWLEGGNVIHPEMEDPGWPRVVPDGEGGTIAVWVGHHVGFHDIYAQRFDAWGDPLWDPGGVPIVVAPNEQVSPAVVPDGMGGAIIAWDDYRGGGASGIYAQRIDGEGGVRWAVNGVAVTSSTGQGPRMVPDGAGGAVVAWLDRRGVDDDIYAQRLDAAGTALWTAGGEAVCATAGDQNLTAVAPSGTGGAYVVWSVSNGSDTDIRAQLVHADGWLEWWTVPSGAAICTASGNQWDPVVTADGNGRAIIGWLDFRGTSYDVYAQLIDEHANTWWTFNGAAINVNPGGKYDLQVVSDAAAGAIFTWDQGDVYAQRVGPAGTRLWTASGVAVCAAPGSQNTPQPVPDGDGGVIVAWEDARFGSYNIYAQRLDAAGTPLWATDGVAVCSMVGDERLPRVTSDGAGGAVIVWEDSRDWSSLYAQRVERNGHWGYPSPVIRAAADVPGDQGGVVDLAWDASRLDPWPAQSIGYYTLWRSISEPMARAMLAEDHVLVSGPADVAREAAAGTIRIGTDGAKSLYWELVGVDEAFQLAQYSRAVPTLYDLTGAGEPPHHFQVIAHDVGGDPSRFWVSPPAAGWSIDNLAPAAPLAVNGRQLYAPDRLEITWETAPEPDLGHFAVYRGPDADFTPSAANLIAGPVEPVIVDEDWDAGAMDFYKVSAIDVHGNEGPHAVLSPQEVTAAGDPVPAPRTRLEAIAPNPFNPSTTVSLSVRDRQTVEIAVYDVLGRRVAMLARETYGPGTHRVTWDGRDAAGRAVASGTYLFRFRAADATGTARAVLVR